MDTLHKIRRILFVRSSIVELYSTLLRRADIWRNSWLSCASCTCIITLHNILTAFMKPVGACWCLLAHASMPTRVLWVVLVVLVVVGVAVAIVRCVVHCVVDVVLCCVIVFVVFVVFIIATVDLLFLCRR